MRSFQTGPCLLMPYLFLYHERTRPVLSVKCQLTAFIYPGIGPYDLLKMLCPLDIHRAFSHFEPHSASGPLHTRTLDSEKYHLSFAPDFRIGCMQN